VSKRQWLEFAKQQRSYIDMTPESDPQELINAFIDGNTFTTTLCRHYTDNKGTK